ncbi:tol-pal system-associated acyl-CoA thioesterase [Castellaniella sp.]|uniref:tol-pal system-associated acyl-CoA thioesterase n=1 Tax=Castellaniella sp. TaxID=1955812 RepID=UPI0035610D14
MTADTPARYTEWPVRVYYEDTDTGGVVYYANYLKFFERARTEWLRGLGLDQRMLAIQEHILFVVRRADVAWRQPARLDDSLMIRTRMCELGASSMLFDQQACRGSTVLADGRIQVCAVNATSFKPVRIPPTLRILLHKAQ